MNADSIIVDGQNGKLSRQLPTLYFADDSAVIYCGDARELLPLIKCDHIITDPPYPKEYIPLYGWLANAAAQVLPIGGNLLAMAGQSYLPEVMARMCPALQYQWIICYQTPGGQAAQIWTRKVITFWKPVLRFVNGDYNGERVSDVVKSRANDKRHHEWGQSESGMTALVDRFSEPGQTICDPFMGAGTTLRAAVDLGRKAIGIEKSEQHCETAKQRLAQGVLITV